MWPALIRGSVFSSIRSSALLPSDNPTDDILPSLHDNLTFNSHIHTINNNNNTTDSRGKANTNNSLNTIENSGHVHRDNTSQNNTTANSLLKETPVRRCEMLSIKELTNCEVRPDTPPSGSLYSSWSLSRASSFSQQQPLDHPPYLDRSPISATSEYETADMDEEPSYHHHHGYEQATNEATTIKMITSHYDDDKKDNNKTKNIVIRDRRGRKKKSLSSLSSSNADTDKEEDDQQKKKANMEDRPFACPLCERRFNRRYNLNAHIRIHDPHRKKLFDCPVCTQSFDRKHDRDRHVDALHFENKRRAHCHLCDASFTRRDALTRHMHKLHTRTSTS